MHIMRVVKRKKGMVSIMSAYYIRGGRPLYGNIELQGSKNSAVAIIMACITVRGKVLLRRVPYISDVSDCISIIRYLGGFAEWCGDGMLSIDCTELNGCDVPSCLTGRMRASTYLMGAELNRFGSCRVPNIGGCTLGDRPIDLHLYAFSRLGARLSGNCENNSFFRDGGYEEISEGMKGIDNCRTIVFPYGKCVGGVIAFSRVTVGGTVNALLASACADGETLILNAAREPHISDMIRFLNKCGADISGEGSSEIRVRGVEALHGCEFTLRGDMIEAGTYLIMGAASKGIIGVSGVDTKELTALFETLEKMGVEVSAVGNGAVVNGQGSLKCTSVSTAAYPGFPTDLHPQLAVLMSIAEGEGRICESVFSCNRFKYLDGLRLFGVKAITNGEILELIGGTHLKKARADAVDLRGGAALVTAAICACGESIIGNVEYIERGYSFMPKKLRSLGADIIESAE